MTKKEVLLKVWSAFSWLWLVYVTAKFIFGKANTLEPVFMFVCYSILALDLILNLVLKIFIKVNNYIAYKEYKNYFEYLKALHKARYKLYFTGTIVDVEIYSKKIERLGNALINVGELHISYNLLSQKQLNQVQIMLDQTKEMMTTTRQIDENETVI